MAQKKNKKKPQQPAPVSPEKYIREKARTFPLGKCYWIPGWEVSGITEVIVTRIRPDGNYILASFLVDTFCLGVKDVFYRTNVAESELNKNLDRIKDEHGLQEIGYNEAHNLIYGAIAFAEEAGISPGKTFNIGRYILEEDTDDIPLIEYEYGHNGKYLLIVGPTLKEIPYITTLKNRLGDKFDFIAPVGEYNDSRNDDDDRILDEEEYSYKHPNYPGSLEVKHQFLVSELYNPKHYDALPDDVVDRILSLPHDEVAEDLSKIVMFEIGRTYREIDDDTIGEPESGTILHALILFGQLNSPKGLDAVLEIMRQNEEFADYHLGDMAGEVIPPALYACSLQNTEPVVRYLNEPGLTSYLRGMATIALTMIVYHHPERREEIIGIYRNLLSSMVTRLPQRNACDGYFAGLVMCELLNIRAKELLPEIKAVYDTGYVDESIAGDYSDVLSEFNKNEKQELLWYYEKPDYHKQYEHLKKMAENYKNYKA